MEHSDTDLQVEQVLQPESESSTSRKDSEEDARARQADVLSDSESETAEEVCGQDAGNPWPYISNYFTFIQTSATGDNLKYRCELCRPAVKYYSTNKRSMFNLKKHISTRHPSEKSKFEICIKIGSSEVCRRKKRHRTDARESQPQAKKHSPVTGTQLTVQESFSGGHQSHHKVNITKNKVNQLILNLVVNEMLPFRIVESEAFINLVKTLQPSNIKEVIGRKALISAVTAKYENCKLMLKKSLLEADCVATTADCWSCRNR